MTSPSDFELRRRERRRRERLRKKRIRAAILLIAIIGVIVLICVSFSTHSQKNEQSGNQEIDLTEVTQAPEEQVIPTVPPAVNPGIPSASDENNLLQILEESGQTKHVYLTFDDGPTDNITPQVLDVLRRYNVKATFFEVGSLIQANPDMARRVHEEGHLIANHSEGHNYEKLYASTETFINEVNECYETIKSITGDENIFKLVRFPGGSYNSSADSYAPVKQECKVTLSEYGFYYCDWNALNGDAEGKTKNAQELFDYMIENLDSQNNVVVLMHDAATKQATVESLPMIIEYFLNNGYTFHRLDDISYQSSMTTSSSNSVSESNVEEGDSDNDSETSNQSSDSSSDSDGNESNDESDKNNKESKSNNNTSNTTITTPKPAYPPESEGGPIIIN
ncbi:MAG: polysaccharide deacetylase [Oscillospiraceae bacterium]|nr:polysaccharide deacetylase [Oscillospiraceae bacterium]